MGSPAPPYAISWLTIALRPYRAAVFFLPMLGQQMGLDLNIISHLIGAPIEGLLRFILWLTGNR
jgi:hypothetical protein